MDPQLNNFMPPKFENILFDLDGTLTDPKEGIVNSILYALKKLDITENFVNELVTFIGPPLRDSFAKRYDLSITHAEKAVSIYREYFSTKGLFENELYPGVTELLETLSAQKCRLFVVTSKPTVYAERILMHFSLDKYFIKIIGSNLDNTLTDKTELIAHVVSTLGLDAGSSVMVGDRKFDMIGARNNSMKAIGVTYGYGSLQELLFEKPYLIVNNCRELERALSRKSAGEVLQSFTQ